MPALLSLQNWYTLQGAYSNSSPLKIRSSELLWWLLWAKCMLLQVLHEIARVRWRGLWCFGVNTSFELFGGWSRGAIRLLSVNLSSKRRLSHTHKHTRLAGRIWQVKDEACQKGYRTLAITWLLLSLFFPCKDLSKDTVGKKAPIYYFFL